MDIKQLQQFLPISLIKYNQRLSDYTTIGIGGRVLAVLEPKTKKDLIKCVRACISLGVKYQVIGNGSNILAKSNFTKMVIITTRRMDREYHLSKDVLTLNAGTFISEAILWCAQRGFSGIEELYGIPATVGGMAVMNAGAFNRQFYDNLLEVEVLDKNKVKWLKKERICYSHHFTNLLFSSMIVLSVKIKLERLAPSVIYSKIKEITNLRISKQPIERNAGSVFRPTKTGEPAGRIIDNLGLKGLRVGEAMVSNKHANFIVNLGFATDQDVKNLIKKVKKIVKEQTGFALEREIEYLGERDVYNRRLPYTYKS